MKRTREKGRERGERGEGGGGRGEEERERGVEDGGMNREMNMKPSFSSYVSIYPTINLY